MYVKISVIIPAFNAETTIAETLDSVAHQTRQPLEIIVVDDGSTDSTAAIAGKHHLLPRVIRTKNKGAAAAINCGIAAATGDLLAFIDADDLWLEKKLELQCALFDHEPVIDVVFSYMESFICQSVPREVAARLVFPVGPQPGFVIGTLMARHDVFLRYGFLDPSLRTGYFIDWFSRARSEGLNFEMLPQVFLKRRVREGTLGRRLTGDGDGLSADFIEIARRAIARNRKS